ncbi:MAG: GDP-mannose 4,6-dehydratase [Promethearchaeota archaeon]
MSKKIALITGVTGQDGSYLAELLLSKGYEVHGIIRRASQINTQRIDHIFDPESKSCIHYGQLDDDSINYLLHELQPDEFYDIGAQSHVSISFKIPVYTAKVVGVSPLRILEAIRKLKLKTKYYRASSSEMFGISPPPQDENTTFQPVSPYGISKLMGYWATRAYRTGYGIFACNGILFNHCSPRRGERFVTRKITRGATRIKLGLQKKLILGNLEAKRDIGFAGDYVRAMWMIMQHDKPDDFVVSTGKEYSIKEFVVKVFTYLDLDWKKYVEIQDIYKRPNEVPALRGNSDKIRKILGWQPEISFDQLVKMMIESDLKLAQQELKLKEK